MPEDLVEFAYDDTPLPIGSGQTISQPYIVALTIDALTSSCSLAWSAIAVVYRPESELASHYFRAALPHQFDEYIWFDETDAVRPLDEASRRLATGPLPESYSFGA